MNSSEIRQRLSSKRLMNKRPTSTDIMSSISKPTSSLLPFRYGNRADIGKRCDIIPDHVIESKSKEVFRTEMYVEEAAVVINNRKTSQQVASFPNKKVRCTIIIFIVFVFANVLYSFKNGNRTPYVESNIITTTTEENAGFFISPMNGFHPEWHPLNRSERFPSVEDRVKLYMSNFYVPPCSAEEDTFDGRFHSFYNISRQDEYSLKISILHTSPRSADFTLTTKDYIFETIIKPDRMFVLWEEALKCCKSLPYYCNDAMKIVSSVKTMTGRKSLSELPPILAQFGDGDPSNNILGLPSLHKFRNAVATKWSIKNATTPEKTELNCTARRKKLETIPRTFHENKDDKFSPIIWPLNYKRHFGGVPSVKKLDTPWEQKKNEAVWRGVMTGRIRLNPKMILKPFSFSEHCSLLPRCCFVRDFWNTTGFDVGFTHQLNSRYVDQEHSYMIKGKLELSSLMKYKIIIIIEGNDVSSGLKWALYSGSVVMMAPPTKTSYAMEELLIPWVHYVPLKPDFSDASEKLNWTLSHDEEARRIAERGTLFIHDLLFHEDSEEDNRRVGDEILSRYMKFFVWKK
jgi:hypothetical protein